MNLLQDNEGWSEVDEWCEAARAALDRVGLLDLPVLHPEQWIGLFFIWAPGPTEDEGGA
jgi:hypothetical protein